MVTIRAFKGLRPQKDLAEKVASLPYDVLNSKEARALAKGNPYAFYKVGKSEVDLPEDINLYDERVYQKARENLQKFIADKVMVQDAEPHLYIYKQKMGNHEQYAVVGCAAVDEYHKGIIKKHELTRKDKEDDRTKHTLTIGANAGPVFLTYRDNKSIDELVANYVLNNAPEYDFVKEDGIGHTFWVIKDKAIETKLVDLFKNVPTLYIADGHHRNASAMRAQAERKAQDPNWNADKEYNYYLAAYFPASQLKILDYNRLLFNMNGMSKEDFMKKLGEKFDFVGEGEHTPGRATRFCMYMDKKWHTLQAKKGTYPENDPIDSLDVAILQKNVLGPLFGIDDPRTSKAIDFVGGIRGHKELEDRVNSGEGKVAFRLHPTSIDQLMAVADADKIMPPKSTWFEPKLRSGIVVHLLD